MARIRSVKPSLRTSRVVASWPMEVRYFWVLLWGYLDDFGRGLDIPKTIAGDCCPLDDKVTAATVDRWITLIATSKVGNREPPLCRYEVDGARYLHSVNWTDNQKPNRPSPSLHPPCPTHEPFTESGSEPRTEAALSRRVLERERELGEGEGEGDSVSGSPRPIAWCSKHPGGTESACRPCGTARLAAEAWDRDAPIRKAARQRAAPRCPAPGHEAEFAATCRLCAADAKARGTA